MMAKNEKYLEVCIRNRKIDGRPTDKMENELRQVKLENMMSYYGKMNNIL